MLIVHPHIFPGGAEREVMFLANYLQEKKNNVSIITLSSEGDLPAFCKNLNIITPLAMTPFRFIESSIDRYNYMFRSALRLRQLVKQHHTKFDILIPHNFPAPLACIKMNKRVVWLCTESPGFFASEDRNFEKKSIMSLGFYFASRVLLELDRILVKKYVNEICVNSQLAREKIQKRYNKNTHLVYSGIDYQFYSSGNGQNAKDKLQLNHDSFTVLQVGQITPQKNQMHAVMAIERLINQIPNIKLVLAGNDKNRYAGEIKSYIMEKKGLQKSVIFTGLIKDEEIRDLYHACDVNIFPTTLQSLGLAPLEGLCAAKIPIVSPLCGASEIIAKYDVGLITTNLESSIKEVYENPEKYREMASKGKDVIRENLSWEAWGQRILNVLNREKSH